LAQSNKSWTRSKATKVADAIVAPLSRRDELGILALTDQRKKPMSLSFRRPSSTQWKTVALEIVEGLGKAVVLIASTVAVVVMSIVLTTMSLLP
jgi:hypothetical protein